MGNYEKLIYNNNIDKLTQKEISKLDEIEFLDYLYKQDEKMPSDDEIILNYNSGTEELIQEIGNFHDRLTALAKNNDVSLKSKFDFIMELLKKDNKKEVLPLLACFMCDMDYIFNLKGTIAREKSKSNLARYIKLKEKIDDFLEKLEFINEQEKTYESFIRQVLKKDEMIKGEEISNENKDILKELFRKYIEIDINEDYFDENLEYIHKFATSTEERKSIYPNLIFRIFTKYQSRLSKERLIINNKNLLNYNSYKIHEDNYKNFKKNENYIRLFFELCNKFCDENEIKLNLFAFEKCSNLGEWYWLQDDKNADFSYGYNSLFYTSYRKYNSIFPDQSRYFEDEQSFRVICFDEEKEIVEDEYIDSLIKEHLDEVMKDQREYLNEYIKGKRYGNQYVEESAHKIIEYADEDLKNNFEFIRHFYWCMEATYIEISDVEVKKDVLRFMMEVEF